MVVRGFYNHPEYEWYKHGYKESRDIAIIYWDKPIKLDEWGISPICLPESGVINNGFEYGRISGWGFANDDNEFRPQPPVLLPIGWVRILPTFNNATDHNGGLVIAKWTPYPEGSVACAVSISKIFREK